MGHTYPTPIRQDRIIRLQDEFVRRPRASTSEIYERARDVRNSVNRQSGFLGDLPEPELAAAAEGPVDDDA